MEHLLIYNLTKEQMRMLVELAGLIKLNAEQAESALNTAFKYPELTIVAECSQDTDGG